MIKESWFNKLRYNWSHERCYTDMDYAGRAASGCCGGLVGGDKSTGYLAIHLYRMSSPCGDGFVYN